MHLFLAPPCRSIIELMYMGALIFAALKSKVPPKTIFNDLGVGDRFVVMFSGTALAFVGTLEIRGRTCLKDTAVPTIFSFPNGKEDQPVRKSLVSEEVSDSPVSAVNITEEVADEDNGSSANNLAADQSNVIMMEDTPEWAFDAHDVMYDDIALTTNVCDDVGLGSKTIRVENRQTQHQSYITLTACQHSSLAAL
ncbi:hypothetical protein ABVT39_017893 [Epinephelus coioides]